MRRFIGSISSAISHAPPTSRLQRRSGQMSEPTKRVMKSGERDANAPRRSISDCWRMGRHSRDARRAPCSVTVKGAREHTPRNRVPQLPLTEPEPLVLFVELATRICGEIGVGGRRYAAARVVMAHASGLDTVQTGLQRGRAGRMCSFAEIGTGIVAGHKAVRGRERR